MGSALGTLVGEAEGRCVPTPGNVVGVIVGVSVGKLVGTVVGK